MTLHEFAELIKTRISDLEKFKQQCKIMLSKAPLGLLYVKTDRGNPRYYQIINKHKNYLSSNKKDLIKALENKNYYMKLEKVTKEQQDVLSDVLLQIQSLNDPEQVFVTIDKRKTHLIKELSLQTKYILKTSNINQFEMPIENNLNYVTKAGERVRSKSELIIANMLYDENISYGYEISCVANFRPDFTVVNPVTGKLFYWEHFGMMDNPEYLSNCINKLQRYSCAGFVPGKNLIVTFESTNMPLNIDYIKSVIKEYLIY